MNAISQQEKKTKVIRIIAGYFFILAGITYCALIFLFGAGFQKNIVQNGDFFLSISFITIGIGLLVGKRIISIIGSCIGILSSIVMLYMVYLVFTEIINWYSISIMGSWSVIKTQYLRKLTFFLLLMILTGIIIIINNKASFFLSSIVIGLYIILQKNILSEIFLFTHKIILIEEKILLSFSIFWLIALIVYTVYLYVTQIKNKEPAKTKVVSQYNNANQAEEIIEKLNKLKNLVDNHVISVQEYVTTKKRLLSSLSPSQQPLVSPQFDNYGSNSISIQSNITANQPAQYNQSSMSPTQNSQTFQPNISGNQYSKPFQQESFNPQNHQYPDFSVMNPYQNSVKKSINNNNEDQNNSSL